MGKTDAGLIVTLKIKLGEMWSADIEIDDLSTLEQLHYAIQDAVGFDDDHLYEFFVARSEHSRPKVTYDDDLLYDTRIRDLYPLLPKHQLYYLFDYGDCWRFKISLSRKKPHAPVDGIEYPHVVSESGEKPKQYNFDDSDDFDDSDYDDDE